MEDKQQQTIERLLDIIDKALDNSTKQNEKALEILNKTNRRNAIIDASIIIGLLSFFMIIYFFGQKVSDINERKNQKINQKIKKEEKIGDEYVGTRGKSYKNRK